MQRFALPSCATKRSAARGAGVRRNSSLRLLVLISIKIVWRTVVWGVCVGKIRRNANYFRK
eukprot:2290534-Amphidinium_carterae.2